MNKHNFIKQLKHLILSANYKAFNEFCYKHKRNVIPHRLYKYTACTEYAAENLKNNQVCLNNPRNFNDPFDCWSYKVEAELQLQPSDESLSLLKMIVERLFDVEVSIDELRGTGATDSLQRITNILPPDKRDGFIRQTKQSLESLVNTSHDGINLLLDSLIRISCFTENPPTKLIMWSHYADYHKGICLEYDLKNCDDDTYAMLMPMIYQENLQSIRGDLKTSEYNYCKLFQTVLYKSKEWSYEREWRLIKALNAPSTAKDFHSIPFLKHIYLGACIANDKSLSDIIKYAHSESIPISKMYRKDNDFSLYSKPI